MAVSRALSKAYRGTTGFVGKYSKKLGLTECGSVKSVISHGVLSAGTGLGLGYLQGKKGAAWLVADKVPLPLLVGVAGSASALIAAMKNSDGAATALGTIADAGWSVFGYGTGLSYGAESKPKMAAAPALGPKPGTTVSGMIPQAVGGAWLSDAELRDSARKA